MLAAAMIGMAAPVAGQAGGYTLSQLLSYGFQLRAATPVPPGGTPAADALYLQGRLPGAAQDIVARCVVRASDADGRNNCQRVH